MRQLATEHERETTDDGGILVRTTTHQGPLELTKEAGGIVLLVPSAPGAVPIERLRHPGRTPVLRTDVSL